MCFYYFKNNFRHSSFKCTDECNNLLKRKQVKAFPHQGVTGLSKNYGLKLTKRDPIASALHPFFTLGFIGKGKSLTKKDTYLQKKNRCLWGRSTELDLRINGTQ